MLRETSFDDSTTAEDEETICFFPTGILQLKYRQIKRLSSREERQQATARIEGLEAEVRRRNQVLETQRRRQEQERLEELAKNIDFKSFFAQYMPQEGGDPLRRTQ